MHTLRHRDRTVNYIDQGDRSWRPMVFMGGLATSVRAFELTEFARTTRERLRLRLISVERNGLGDTPLDPSLGIDDAVDDVLFVLDRLRIERAAIVAFSGGGPYAAALAARAPDRVMSLHLAAAAVGHLIATSAPAAAMASNAVAFAQDPAALWRFPDDSQVQLLPGFAGATEAEGIRALGTDGHGAASIAHEWRLLCSVPLPRHDTIRAPAYLYHGTHDEIVPPLHAKTWQRALGGSVTLRLYEGEGHDVQYRHWDQILVDVAGSGDRVLISQRGSATLFDPDEAERLVRAGATLGLPAWAPVGPVQSPPGC